VPESFGKPEEYFNVNVMGTVNLLEAMREAGVKKIVFSSTAAVYDPAGKMPLSEDSAKKPYSPYGASKLAMEEVMYYYHLSYGFDVVIFRYFNAYGPGDYKKNPNNVVPKFFKLCLNNQVLPIHGDGSMVRDYVYVEDLAKAHLKGLAIKGFKVYNLGSGHGQTVDTLIQQISKSSGLNCRIKHQKIPPGYPDVMLADVSKVKKELGWEPIIKLSEGIQKTGEFFMMNY
jgi:UDP-glucose 4-epimerase